MIDEIIIYVVCKVYIGDQGWCKIFKWIKFRVKQSCASKHTKWIPLVWIISSGFTQWSVCVHVRTYVHESISIRQVIALECLGRHWGGTWLVFKCVTVFFKCVFYVMIYMLTVCSQQFVYYVCFVWLAEVVLQLLPSMLQCP